MGFLTGAIKDVIRGTADAVAGRASNDGSRRTSGDGSRRVSGDGSRSAQPYQQQGYPQAAYGYHQPAPAAPHGPGLPPPHPTMPGASSHVATPVEVAQAYGLVESAVADLKEAIAGLQKQSGIMAAAKAIPENGWKEAGKTMAHDGRFPAKQLCESAITKYEQAAQLVDGLPEIETSPEIQEGRLKEMARSVGGTAGTGTLAAAMAGAQITTAVLVGFTPFGIIKKAVKKKRCKKAAANVEDLLSIVEHVRSQLEALHRRGMGGSLEAAYPPQDTGYIGAHHGY